MKSTRRQAVAWLAWLAVLVSTACSHGPRESEEGRLRYQKAAAMFKERCQKSGEFIHRTADNVEGIFLIKLRPQEINYGHTKEQQFRLDDPYGRTFSGDGYIKSFLWGRNEKNHVSESAKGGGYRYVEAIDEKDGKRYRYTGAIKAIGNKDASAFNVQLALKRDPNYDLNIYAFVLDKVPAPGPAPRYGVTYDDISTHEERGYWIAGSSLRVIDLQTNEVMAERIGYMMDPGQGAKGGGRAPWLFAADNACPQFGPEKVGLGRSFFQSRQTREFVEKILHTIQEQ